TPFEIGFAEDTPVKHPDAPRFAAFALDPFQRPLQRAFVAHVARQHFVRQEKTFRRHHQRQKVFPCLTKCCRATCATKARWRGRWKGSNANTAKPGASGCLTGVSSAKPTWKSFVGAVRNTWWARRAVS